MAKIRPIRDLRNTIEISRLCHQTKEPVFITKNGYGDLVIMSMDAYEDLMCRIDLHEKLRVAEDQVEYGARLKNAEDVFTDIKNKHADK